jgi:hypothetical protein
MLTASQRPFLDQTEIVLLLENLVAFAWLGLWYGAPWLWRAWRRRSNAQRTR